MAQPLAKIVFVWDFENVPLQNPATVSPFIEKLRSLVREKCEKKNSRYSEEAFDVLGDPHKIDRVVYTALVTSPGINFIAIANGRKNELDLKLINQMNQHYQRVAEQFGGCLVIIAGDSDYAHSMLNYKNKAGWDVIMICREKMVPARLHAAWTDCIGVESLLAGLTPLERLPNSPGYLLVKPLPENVSLTKVCERLEQVTTDYKGKVYYINKGEREALLQFPDEESAQKATADLGRNPEKRNAYGTIFQVYVVSQKCVASLNGVIKPIMLKATKSKETNEKSNIGPGTPGVVQHQPRQYNNAANSGVGDITEQYRGQNLNRSPSQASQSSNNSEHGHFVMPEAIQKPAAKRVHQCIRWQDREHDRTKCPFRHPSPCRGCRFTAYKCEKGHLFCKEPQPGTADRIYCTCGPKRDPKLHHLLPPKTEGNR